MAKPLTKRKLDGTLYFRPPEVEANIDGAIDQPLEALQSRLHATKTAPNYLKSECLVHLLRRAIEREDDARITAVHETLARRIDRTLRNRLLGYPPHIAEEVGLDVLYAVNELFSARSEELDYYEAKFNRALQTLYLAKVPPLDAALNVEVDDDRARKNPGPSLQERAALSTDLGRALDMLPKEEREAFLLVEEMRYKIESKDPHEITAATICDVSGRTIRTRLHAAKCKLAAILKDYDS